MQLHEGGVGAAWRLSAVALRRRGGNFGVALLLRGGGVGAAWGRRGRGVDAAWGRRAAAWSRRGDGVHGRYSGVARTREADQECLPLLAIRFHKLWNWKFTLQMNLRCII